MTHTLILPLRRHAALGLRLAFWRRNRRSRQALALLPDYLLDDIGLTHAQAGRELRKPFWRP